MKVIGYDVGTTGFKAGLYELTKDDIRLLAGSVERYALHILPNGGAEQDPDDWWNAMLKWIDVAFPKKYIEQFQGPKFGVEGLREKLGVYDRPLLNAMIKPNIGWTPEEGAELFYEAAKGGVDIIKDDELMAHPPVVV